MDPATAAVAGQAAAEIPWGAVLAFAAMVFIVVMIFLWRSGAGGILNTSADVIRNLNKDVVSPTLGLVGSILRSPQRIGSALWGVKARRRRRERRKRRRASRTRRRERRQERRRNRRNRRRRILGRMFRR